MIDLEQAVPEQWRGAFRVFILPVVWLFPLQNYLFSFVWYSDYWSVALFKRVFLFLPYVALMAALWCSMLSVYTLLFRGGRLRYISTVLVLWWDVARSIWLFWAGMGKFLFV